MKLTLSPRYRDWCIVNHRMILDDKRIASETMAMHFNLTISHTYNMLGIYLSDYNGQINNGKIDERQEDDLVPMPYDRVQRLERPLVEVKPIRTEYKGNKIILTYDSRANY